MERNDERIVLEFKEKLPLDIRSNLVKLIVFGSRARGDHTNVSDLDILALVKNKDAGLERKMEDAAYEIMWTHDFNPLISLKIITESKFNESYSRGFSFYRNIVREGVPV